MRYLTRLLLTSLLSLFVLSSFATQTTLLVDGGNWHTNENWTNGAPGCIDTVIIPAGMQVNITSTIDLEACPDSMLVIVYGRIEFQNGKKLKLPCLSDVMVMDGGSIGVGSGGGSSTYIEICGNQYWNASSGDLTGPQSLCDGPCPPSMLPIDLLFFDAIFYPPDRYVKLLWTTKSETDNDYFTLQRSTNAQDFMDIGTVEGAGNSSYEINYEFFDNYPLSGISYYRLKQTDFNGAYSYSRIIAVNNEYSYNQQTFVVSEAPSNTVMVYFVSAQSETVNVQIVSANGQIVFVDVVNTMNNQLITINPNKRLAPGIYYIIADKEIQKVVVM